MSNKKSLEIWGKAPPTTQNLTKMTLMYVHRFYECLSIFIILIFYIYNMILMYKYEYMIDGNK